MYTCNYIATCCKFMYVHIASYVCTHVAICVYIKLLRNFSESTASFSYMHPFSAVASH